MDVTPGFKQSDVGAIPDDWELHSIGKSMRLINGRAFKPSDWKERGLPIIRIQNLNNRDAGFNYYDGRVDEKYHLRPGDLVFAWSGTTGTSFGARIWDGPEGILNQHIFKVLPDTHKLTPRYAFHVLLKVQAAIERHAHGFKASFVHVKKSDLVTVLLPLPPTKAEQEAIAEALSDADALIESLEQLIAKKRLIKQGAMQELLTGKRRLPGFEGRATDSLPAGWKTVSLIDLVGGKKDLFDDGDWIEAEHITNQGIRLIQTRNVGLGKYLEKGEKKYIYEASYRKLKCKPLRIGDLLICRLAEPAGRACILPDIGDERVVTSVDVTIFRPPTDRADRRYLVNVFSTSAWLQMVAEKSGGTTHKRIARGALGRIRVLLPPITEQAAIADILDDMDKELDALGARLDKTRQIKQGMMHNLLTGKVRLV